MASGPFRIGKLNPMEDSRGKIRKAAVTAVGDVLVNLADQGMDYSAEQTLLDFAVGFVGDLAGGGLADLVTKYGAPTVAKGLAKMGFDYQNVAKWLGGGIKKIDITLNGVTAYRMMKGWVKGKIAVIGRNMDDRVRVFADAIGAETFKPTQAALGLWDAGDSSLLKKENADWIKKLKEQGYTIYDVGLDPRYTAQGNFDKGEFYGMETNEVFGDPLISE